MIRAGETGSPIQHLPGAGEPARCQAPPPNVTGGGAAGDWLKLWLLWSLEGREEWEREGEVPGSAGLGSRSGS